MKTLTILILSLILISCQTAHQHQTWQPHSSNKGGKTYRR